MSWLRLMEENIKEMEEAGSNPELPADVLPTGRHHRVSRLIKDMWPAYLIEIFVIILGIGITLALEEWRDAAKEKEIESIYLRNLATDVQADRVSLSAASAATNKILEDGRLLITGVSGQSMPLSPNVNLNGLVRSILGRPKFLSQDATFSDLKSSGNLHLIKDISLKNILFSYYSQTQSIKEVQDAEQAATINISGPYFLKNFSLGDAGSRIKPADEENIVKSVEFENNVLLRLSNRRELFSLYQRADSTASRLSSILNSSR